MLNSFLDILFCFSISCLAYKSRISLRDINLTQLGSLHFIFWLKQRTFLSK